MGNGTVFKLAPPVPQATLWTETVLYSFCSLSSCSDGAYPEAGLIADSSGNLYGTTEYGGASNAGMVFKLSPGGTETVLYSFTGGSDGADPVAGLIADSSGNLYNTTLYGGGSGCYGPGCGTVFELTGTGFTTASPFLAFKAALEIDFGRKPNTDAFALESSFTLSSTAPAIDPVTQPVTLQAGTFTTTIPAGSFKKIGPLFTFAGAVNGVSLQALITPTGTLRYAFAAAAEKAASLAGTTNPVPVTLTIGNDTGTTSVTAVFASGVATAH